VIADDETIFDNVFTAKGKNTFKLEQSHRFKTHKPPPRTKTLPHHALPKLHFHKTDGSQPKICWTNVTNYFHIYQIPEHLWVEAATMHLEDNAAKWWQVYKITNPKVSWKQLSFDVQQQFGSDDHRSAINDLLDLRQTSTVEEYTTKFKSLQYDVSMHGSNYDAMFFATQYVRGLRDDVRAMVEP
jgi:hypothetical protein